MITRHNYEEYFILYMDNELGSDERRMVEAFVQQHPDLKDELDTLFQYKLTPDTNIVFEGKEELIKTNGDTPFGLVSYQEGLILYLDNELTDAQKTITEELIAANPAVKKEFALFQRTKLQPEEIIFADKASLYRTAEKVRPMPVRWWRLAAAAVLLLGIGITTAVLMNQQPAGTEKGIARETKPVKKPAGETPAVLPKEANGTLNENVMADISNKEVFTAVENQAPGKMAMKQKNLKLKTTVPVLSPVNNEPVIAAANKATNDLPKPLNNPNIIKNDVANNAVAVNNIPKEIINPKDALTNSVVTNKNSQPSDIRTASFRNTDDAAFEQPDDKKNKSRGFFRKIARTFEKRTSIDPTDDNKLLVAGLSIRLK